MIKKHWDCFYLIPEFLCDMFNRFVSNIKYYGSRASDDYDGYGSLYNETVREFHVAFNRYKFNFLKHFIKVIK